MRRYIIYIEFILLAACYPKPEKDFQSKITDLPSFRIMSLDSSKCIDAKDMITGTPIIFMYFGPDCDLCHQETKTLLKHLDKLEHASIYMISNQSSEANKRFYQTFRLDTAQNIVVCSDYDHSFYNIFLPNGTPFLVIYDAHGKLKKVYRESPSMTSIINALKI